MKDFFIARINEAGTVEELEYIINNASFELESNADYNEVFELAMSKAQTISTF